MTCLNLTPAAGCLEDNVPNLNIVRRHVVICGLDKMLLDEMVLDKMLLDKMSLNETALGEPPLYLRNHGHNSTSIFYFSKKTK
jgi:hypothetical protein